MKNEEKKIVYTEPDDYFPKEIREKYKLGEFAEPENVEEAKCIDDKKMVDFIDKNWAEYQKAQENLTSDETEEYLEDCGGIQPDEPLPMLENDKAPTKPISEQKKTIQEKWEEGEITILPPKEKLAKEEILEKLRNPTLPNDKKNELMDLLYEGIDIKSGI